MRSTLRRRGWRIGAIDREEIYESFYKEVPALSQGVELSFRHKYNDHGNVVLLRLAFYRMGTAHRPRDFPKGDYLQTLSLIHI